MELSQLRYFILTAQLQNMSQASRALHITQPTLSKSISNLERELGVQLFDRNGKKLRLNENGRRFLEKTALSVQELDTAAAATRKQATQAFLHLGLFHTSSNFLTCINDFALQNPDIALQIDHIMEPAASIDTNEFDMLIYPRSTQFRSYAGQPLFTESYYLALHTRHPLAQKRTITMSDLQDQRIIFVRSEKNSFELPYYVCKSSGLEAPSMIITNSREVHRHLIIGGACIGFVGLENADMWSKNHHIEIREVSGADMRQEVMIGFKRPKRLSDNGRLLSEFIRSYYHEKRRNSTGMQNDD